MIYRVFVSMLALMALTGCGAINFVTGASLSTSTIQGSDYAQLDVKLNSAGLIMPTVSIPIFDPSHPSLVYASVTLSPTDLEISVDLSAVAGLPATNSNFLLPNGTSLPVSNYDSSSMMEFNPAGSHSQVYIELNTGKKEALFGAAIVIPEFNIGVPADLFVPFVTKDGISGTAGVFTGSAADESGFAVFVDVSSVLSKGQVLKIQKRAMSLANNLNAPEPPLGFASVRPSNSDMKKLNRMLQHLQKNRIALHVN